MRRVFLVFFLLLLLIAVFPYGLSFHRTVQVISANVPSFPQWFAWGTYEVLTQEVSLRDNLVVDLYLPRDISQTSFIILVPGFTPEGSGDPRIVSLARSFAAAGIGAAVPDSPHIRAQRFLRQDIDFIKETFRFLQAQPYADSQKIALSGFSIAGAYVLRAAAELGNQPLFVHSLGGYYDLGELLVEILSGQALYKNEERMWRPDAFPQEVAKSILSEELDEERAELLLLKRGMGVKEARHSLALLSLEAREALHGVSPAPMLSDMNTQVFLMHDRNDAAIPVEESRKISDALSSSVPVSFHEFTFLSHVVPQKPLGRDALGLFWQVFRMMMLFH